MQVGVVHYPFREWREGVRSTSEREGSLEVAAVATPLEAGVGVRCKKRNHTWWILNA